MEEIIKALKIVVANSYIFQLKAQNYHWNVVGADFVEYHSLFGEIYSEVYSSIDTLSEQIRKLGAYSPGSFTRFLELAYIEEELNFPDARTMTSRLMDDAVAIKMILAEAYDVSEAAGTRNVSNLLAERIDAFSTHIWKLSASLGVSAPQT